MLEVAYSALFGSFLVLLTLTPLDVIKTRMQTGSTITLVIKQGGLWRGLGPSLLVSLPQTVSYLVLYEEIKSKCGPALGGAVARSFACSFISPIELFKTKIQAGYPWTQVVNELTLLVKSNGILALWRGLGPTLARDAPFSAIYWASIENSKPALRYYFPIRSYTDELLLDFMNGSISGLMSALITHPFDVIKTIQQVDGTKTRHIVQNIYLHHGPRGFFLGLLPRMSKVVPGCGIMIASYELGKRFFGIG